MSRQNLSSRFASVSSRKSSLRRRASAFRGICESLEIRNLLSTIVGEVVNDLNGNGLRDVGEPGLSGVTVNLDQLNTSTGTSTPVTTTTTDSNGVYKFDNLAAGTYRVSEQTPTGSTLTFPTAEHTARSYMIQLGSNETAGDTTTMVAPSDNWLASLKADTYTFPIAGDFMFQFGSSGVAPSRVFLSGTATVVTKTPVTTPNSGSDGSNTTTVDATMTQLVLHGTVSSDQHEQGYLGTITMTLTANSSGQITSRKDSASLADSNFDVNATIEIPNAFGIPTRLHTAVPINFLAREISSFPALGSSYQYRGTQPPISLVDNSGTEQGKIYFASLNPMAGYDFGDFTNASVQGRAYIDANGNGQFDTGETPLVNQPVVLTQVIEESGPSGEEGSGGSGSGGAPEGKGESPMGPKTVYTDSQGNYVFPNLGPGGYTVSTSEGDPLTITSPAPDHSYTITALTSGSNTSYDFAASFTPDTVNHSTAPTPYPPATNTLVPNLHLGATAYANAAGQSYINDGVRFGSALVPGTTVPLTITVTVPQGQTAYLSGWLDAFGNKTFSGTDAIQLSDGTTLSDLAVTGDSTTGVQTLHLNVVVPTGMTLANGQLSTYARFRLSTTQNPGPADPSPSPTTPPPGETEDIPVTIYDSSQLGEIQGQTFEDVNGDGAKQPTEPVLPGWTVQLIDLSNSQVVATQTSDANGLYDFKNVMPGKYEVSATPPNQLGTAAMTAPGDSEEGAVVYRFNVTPGEHIGNAPVSTTPASPGWLQNFFTTDQNLSLFTLGQFMILRGGSGSSGDSGTSTDSSQQPIRIEVTGAMQVKFNPYDAGTGLVSSQITGIQLQGIAVADDETGGAPTVLGPVTVTLGGMFNSQGTLGASSGQGDGESDTASYSLYIQFDLTSLGLGTVTNTRPLNVSGTVTQMPMIGTILARSGGGSPIPLRDLNGAEPVRLATASLTTMSGLDFGAAYLGGLSGTVYKDNNGDGVQDTGDNGLGGATVVVTQVLTEEGSSDEGHSGSGGHQGGMGGEGGGETTTPEVYRTLTAPDGTWSITDLMPGSYTVTVIPPNATYGVSGGSTLSYPETIQSQSQITGINFGNYPINQPPVIAAPGAQHTQEDKSVVFSTADGNALSISDPDAGDQPVQVTLQATGGQLTLASTTGLTFDNSTANGSAQIVVTGTLADINAALNGVTFTPNLHASGADNIAVSVNDLGNTGLEGAKNASSNVAVNIAAVANAPTLSVSDASGKEDERVGLNINPALVDTDGSETLSVTIHGLPSGATLSAGTNLGGGNWKLSPAQLNGLTLTSPVSGTYTLTVSATSEEANGSTASTDKPLVVSLASITPVVSGLSNMSTEAGSLTQFHLGQFATQGTNGPWTVTINWGDSTADSTFSAANPGDLGAQPHTYVNAGTYTVTVSVTDRYSHVGQNQFQVQAATGQNGGNGGSNQVGPVTVQHVFVNNLSPQRSMVTSMMVVFSGPVTWENGAFQLYTGSGQPINSSQITLNVAPMMYHNQAVAILTFSGPQTILGSVPDGQYQVRIMSNLIHDLSGNALDLNHDGQPGGTMVVPFFRLAGDLNGDGQVDMSNGLVTNPTFRLRYRRNPNLPTGFLRPNDLNGDGVVNMEDRLIYRSTFRRILGRTR